MESGPCRGLSQLWVVHGGQFLCCCVFYSPVKTRYYGPFVAPVVVRQYRSAVSDSHFSSMPNSFIDTEINIKLTNN